MALLALGLALGLGLAGAAEVRGTLSGRVVDWPGGTGEVRIEASGVAVSAGTVDADGQFRVSLPAEPSTSVALPFLSGLFAQPSNFGEGCRGEGRAEPGTGRYRFFEVVVWQGGERLGDLTLDSSAQLTPAAGEVSAPLLHFTAKTTLNGTVVCREQAITDELVGTFAAGWHLAPRRVTAVSPSGEERTRLTAAALPVPLAWRLYREYGGLGLNFRPDEDGRAVIDLVRPGLPGARAGIQAGDRVLSVDGRDVSGLAFAQVLRLVRGPAGSTVRLGLGRAGRAPLVLELSRELIRVP